MTYLIQLVVSGIALGAIYALIALGYVIMFRATAVINFAHGSFLMVGAFFTTKLALDVGLGFWLAFLLAILGVALLAMLIERGIIRPMIGRSLFVLAIITLGVDQVIVTLLQHTINDHVYAMETLGAEVLNIWGIPLNESRLAALVAAVVIAGAFFTWFKLSAWGVGMRAAAEDATAAALMGIRLGRVSSVAWGLGGALAAVAGVFLSTAPSAGLDPSLRLVAFQAFPAAVLGGMDSTSGAVVGGLIIGIATQVTTGYDAQLSFLGSAFHTVVPYVVLIVVLVVRPQGLFGTKELARV